MDIIFKTKRLIIRSLVLEDRPYFYKIMGDPDVCELIPSTVLSKKESLAKLKEFIQKDLEGSSTRVWGVAKHDDITKIIGICGFLENDEGDKEIAYRLAKKFWKKGFGSEIAEGIINYGFTELNVHKITADVAISNTGSVKILERFMELDRVFFNNKDEVFDGRYYITRE